MYRKVYEITGYTYDAAAHCLDCAKKRYPDLHNISNTDSEGNYIHPIFLGDKTDTPHYCDECFKEIECTVIMCKHSKYISDGCNQCDDQLMEDLFEGGL